MRYLDNKSFRIYAFLCILVALLEILPRWLTSFVGALFISFLLVSSLSFIYKHFLRSKKLINFENKAVLITGCDSGFGLQIAKTLDQLNVKVYAGCLSTESEGATILRSECSKHICILKLDITNETDIREALQVIEGQPEDLWAIVNNAGIVNFGEFEWCDINDVYLPVYNVNVIGSMKVTKVFLPSIRKSQGRIIFIGSIAGEFALPGFSAYSMSKTALYVFFKCLKLEMEKFGVSVHIIKPNAYRTKLSNKEKMKSDICKIWNSCSEEMRNDYGEEYLTDFKECTERFMRTAYPESKIKYVIDDVIDAVVGSNPLDEYIPQIHVDLKFQILKHLSANILKKYVTRYMPKAVPVSMKKQYC